MVDFKEVKEKFNSKKLKKYLPFIAIGGLAGVFMYVKNRNRGEVSYSPTLPEDSYNFIGNESLPQREEVSNFVDYTDKFLSIQEEFSSVNESLKDLGIRTTLISEELDKSQDNEIESVTNSVQTVSEQPVYKDRSFTPQVVDEQLSSQIDLLESQGFKVDSVSSSGVTKTLVKNNIPPEYLQVTENKKNLNKILVNPQTSNEKIVANLKKEGITVGGTNSRVVDATLKRLGKDRSDYL